MNQPRLTKKERRELRQKDDQSHQTTTVNGQVVLGLVAILVTGVVIGKMVMAAKGGQKPTANSSNIVSQSGIHWHPELAVFINGQKQEVPANLGIGKQYSSSKWYDPMMDMTDFHTHDNSGTLHWEVMDGPVTKDHITLKAFFEVWGKRFDSNCIFDSCNGSSGNLKMTVNGQPNTEFESYQVHDKDKIEIRYE